MAIIFKLKTGDVVDALQKINSGDCDPISLAAKVLLHIPVTASLVAEISRNIT